MTESEEPGIGSSESYATDGAGIDALPTPEQGKVCDQCGSTMVRADKLWTCADCGNNEPYQPEPESDPIDWDHAAGSEAERPTFCERCDSPTGGGKCTVCGHDPSQDD